MKLFKRKFNDDGTEDRDASYYVRFMVKGKMNLWSCKTNDATLARSRAKVYRTAIVNEEYHLVNSMKSRSTVLSFADLFKQYQELPLTVTADTRTKNLAGMRLVMDMAGIVSKDRVDKLGVQTGLKFQQESLKAGVPASTINSRLRAAKSLFSARALMGYEPQLPMSVVDDFKRVPSLREDERLPDIPSPESIELAHKNLPDDPDVYRCFLLAAYVGMRAGEIVAARWDWIVDDVIYIGGAEFQAKSRKWRPARIDPSVLALIHGAGPKHEVFIGGKFPKEAVSRRMPGMLREIGFTSRQPTHAARRWAGSIVADAQGIYAAQNLLGHSTPAVTAKSYARMINLPAAIPLRVAANPAAIPLAPVRQT